MVRKPSLISTIKSEYSLAQSKEMMEISTEKGEKPTIRQNSVGLYV